MYCDTGDNKFYDYYPEQDTNNQTMTYPEYISEQPPQPDQHFQISSLEIKLRRTSLNLGSKRPYLCKNHETTSETSY